MTERLTVVLALGFASALGLAGALAATTPDQPLYDAKGNLIFPSDYRNWVFLSSGLDMLYKGEETDGSGGHLFENVFVPQPAYDAFRKTGTWPDKTMLLMERRAGATNVSINVSGAVQTETLQGLSVHVHDTVRFKDTNGWAFFGFNPGDKTGQKLQLSMGCNACHEANGAVDTTFVQFYPTLIPIAKAHGTYKPPPGDPQ